MTGKTAKIVSYITWIGTLIVFLVGAHKDDEGVKQHLNQGLICAIASIIPLGITQLAALVFAIFLIVTFAAFDETFLIATLVYTLLSLITALIVKFICESNKSNNNLCELLNDILRNSNADNLLNNVSNNCNTNNETNFNTVSDILSSNNSNNNNNNSSCGCGCSRYRRYR